MLLICYLTAKPFPKNRKCPKKSILLQSLLFPPLQLINILAQINNILVSFSSAGSNCGLQNKIIYYISIRKEQFGIAWLINLNWETKCNFILYFVFAPNSLKHLKSRKYGKEISTSYDLYDDRVLYYSRMRIIIFALIFTSYYLSPTNISKVFLSSQRK